MGECTLKTTVPSGRVNNRAIGVKSGNELLELICRQGVMKERQVVIYRPAGVTRAG